MSQNHRSQSSSLFLTELILAILFFSLCSAVCLQFFVKSHLLSRDSQTLNYAVNESSGVAEIIDSSKDQAEAASLLTELYPDAVSSGGVADGHTQIRVCFDQDYAPCKEEEASYQMEIDLYTEAQMLHGDICVTSEEDEEIVYELSTEHYMQRRADDES